MHNLKVSIITVCLNSAKTIEQTIKSVVEQPYNNIEYIIIDGGSADGTLDIIRKYDEHVAYWVSEPDHGIYDAMNKGIQRATGDIVGIINSDDWYEEDAIGLIARFFLTHPEVEFVQGDVAIVQDNEVRRTCKGVKKDEEKPLSWYNHPSVFIRKSIYEHFGAYKTCYLLAADVELMLRMRYSGVRIAYIPAVLAYFRLEGVSNRRRWRLMIEIRNIHWDIIQRNKLDIFKAGEVRNAFRAYRMSLALSYIKKRAQKHGNWGKILKKMLRVREKNNFILWGSGNDGEKMILDFGDKYRLIDYVVDSDVGKQGKKICDLKIKATDKLSRESMILISTQRFGKEIRKQLEQKGFFRYKDFLLYQDFYYELFYWYCKEVFGY